MRAEAFRALRGLISIGARGRVEGLGLEGEGKGVRLNSRPYSTLDPTQPSAGLNSDRAALAQVFLTPREGDNGNLLVWDVVIIGYSIPPIDPRRLRDVRY